MEAIVSTLLVILLIFVVPAYLRHRRQELLQEDLLKISRSVAVDISLLSGDFLKDEDNQADIQDYIEYTLTAKIFTSEQNALISLHACILSLTVYFAITSTTRNFEFSKNLLQFLASEDFPLTQIKITNIYNSCIDAVNSCNRNQTGASHVDIVSQILQINHVTTFNDLHYSIINHVANCYVALKPRYPALFTNTKSN